MGGFGSGRKSGKNTTEDRRKVDVRHLARGGYLKAGMAYRWQWTRHGENVASINLTVEADRVWFTYRQRGHSGDWRDMRYAVGLERTACHLGGARVWWRCPVAGCGRRVAVMYDGGVFACRHCHDLAYRCQREADDYRAIRKADTLRKKLKWVPGIAHGEGPKPKGMHWRTFERLYAEYTEQVSRAFGGVSQRLERCQSRLSTLL